MASNSNTFTLGNTLPSELEKVKPSGGFNEILTVAQLVEHLKSDLKGVDLNSNKLKPSFIKYILDKIKTIIINTENFDKQQLKELANQTLKQLIPGLSDSDLKVIDDILDTLINNKLVKAIDNSVKAKICNIFKKKN